MNWKKLRKNIPKEINIGPNKKFIVEWVDSVGKNKNGREQYGETKFNPNTIKLYKGQEDKDAVLTFFHEFLHTFHAYKDFQLSEKHVKKLEKKFEIFFKLILELNKDD